MPVKLSDLLNNATNLSDQLMESPDLSRFIGDVNSSMHFNFDVEKYFPKLDFAQEIAARISGLIASVNDQLKSLAPMLEEFTRHEKRCIRLEEAGWLPHPSSSWHLLDDDALSADALNEQTDHYYRREWKTVRAKIEESIAEYLIDDEAKATFLEALTAHEAGLYRCVARTIFPEIERVSRAAIHGGAMDKMASQQKLRAAIGELCPADMQLDGISSLRLYDQLMSHLYESIPTQEHVATIAAVPVPNRHATVHGYVSYNTARHSMNALIVAEYLFHAISVIVQLDREEADTPDEARAA